MRFRNIFVVSSLAIGLAALAAQADPTSYPLEIENCGHTVTFEEAPRNAVALGQNSAEIMLMLGLEDRMAATAFWPNEVLPELAEANAEVELLTVEFPTLEAVLSKQPDFVAAMLVTLMGPDSKVAKREDFHRLDIPTYLSPSACSVTAVSTDIYGARDDLWTMDQLYKEIEDLSRIFDVVDRGEAVIADLKAREDALQERFQDRADLTFLFWFSSPSPEDDAYLAGGNGPSTYIADLLGGSNAIKADSEWPALGWESIMASDPTVRPAQIARDAPRIYYAASTCPPSSLDHVWMAPAWQGRCSGPAPGRSRPCIRRRRCSAWAARPDE